MIRPNLFIVGAAKAGTTSLHRILAGHPEVAMSRIKEPHFFADVAPNPAMPHFVPPVKDLAAYLDLFPPRPAARFAGEASPSYLYDESAPARIKDASPQAKIVVMLRDPVERAYSHYLMDVREGIQHLSFADALKEDSKHTDRRWNTACHLYVDLGLYGLQVRRYLEVFASEQVHLIETDDLRTSAGQTLGALARFLGIDPEPLTSARGSPQNTYAAPRSPLTGILLRSRPVRSVARRVTPSSWRRSVRDRLLFSRAEKPAIEATTRWALQSLFAEDLAQLRELTGMPFPTLSSRWL